MTRACSSWAWLAIVVAAISGGPSRAHAFSDPTSFGLPPEMAGGGGRYFTGSVADGYSCKACHDGSSGAPLVILGVPLAGYELGVSYEITVQWPTNYPHMALAAELTDREGRKAGSVRLPTGSELKISEQCQPLGAVPVPAASLLETSTRTIIQMSECSAQQLRFLWTAPQQDVGPVWLAGSAVRSDAQQDPHGDGVTDFERVIGSPTSQNTPASSIAGGCSIAGVRARRTSTHALVWAALLLLGATVVRRRWSIGRAHSSRRGDQRTARINASNSFASTKLVTLVAASPFGLCSTTSGKPRCA